MMTKIKHTSLALIPVVAGLVMLGACSESKPVNKAGVATSFVQAITQNNADKAVQLSATPLSIRNQEWESAQDGRGFVLGKALDEQLTDQIQIRGYFSENIQKIGVEGTNPTSATLTLLKDELAGIEGRWQGLDIYLFLRGMGDVEHIFVLGINAKGKVSAIYFN